MSIPLEHVDEVSSTSAILRQRAERGGVEAALLAARQTAGRGRLGRVWQSPPGNLHLSVLLRPPVPLAPGHWSLLAAVVLAECVASYGAEPRLKWPNDVLLGEAKLAGILLEAGSEPAWLVIGFGVNLRHAPQGLGRSTAALADVVPAPEPAAFAARLLEGLSHWRRRLVAEGFDPIRAAWLARGPVPGALLTLGSPGPAVTGTFAGLAPNGALLLDTDGRRRTITSGEVQ